MQLHPAESVSELGTVRQPSMLTALKTASVFTLPVHLAKDYTGILEDFIKQNVGGHVVTLNSEMSMLAEENPDVGQVIRKADLVIPDGAGVILYLRLRNIRQARCPGIELAESLLRLTGEKYPQHAIAFYGGQPGVTNKAAAKWQAQYPGLLIFSNHGFLTPEQQEAWCNLLKEKQPKIILVGLGVPRQEFWIRDHRHLCPNSLWIGVGGSFDIWSGQKIRAPKFFCDNNLEWLYRLYQEPWRWRRMLALPQFVWRSIWYRD
ncbi:MAG: WecB/TagA/CpsF family glycosyltransferase [Snowella sp.]|nr:WecB/TagA/CpsF family glycosyltransferase [Snowella sp.]